MSPPLNLIHDFDHIDHSTLGNIDHIDHSTLGNIDPDTNFLSNINTSICKYYTELEFNQQFPQVYKLSMFNLNVRSLPKNIDKVKHFLEGLHYNFSILSFTETWFCDYNILLIISMDTLTYLKLEEITKWEGVFRCLLIAELIIYVEMILNLIWNL